jgi:hypothetical protein
MGSLLILVMTSVALGKVLACRRFVRAICEVLEAKYLRQSIADDLQCQLDIHAKKGLIGMFVYLDCMQYR